MKKLSRSKKLLAIIGLISLAALLPVQAVMAATTATVTVTVTPGRISLTLDNTTWTPGTLNENEVYYSTDSVSVTTQTNPISGGVLADAACYWTVTNNGTRSINVAFTSGNWTGGATPWTNGVTAAGADAYWLQSAAAAGSGAAWVNVNTAGSAATISSLAASGTKKFALKLAMPTAPTVLDQKSGTITLTASAA
jgi:hypothetical protein